MAATSAGAGACISLPGAMNPQTGEQQAAHMRAVARQLFLNALAECSVARVFDRDVNCDRGMLRVVEDLYDLHAYDGVLVVSFGKAAIAMAEALTNTAGSNLRGFVVDVSEPSRYLPGFEYFRGGHPVPNAESLHAARTVLRALERQTQQSLVIFLISGGGSSLLELPIDDEISLPDLIETYRALVLSGAPIAEINAIRKHLSAVKGGRISRAAAPAQQVSIMISDVPDATPDALASGPTMPDSTTIDDCEKIAHQYKLLERFPASVRELFERHALSETPKSDDPAFARSRWWTILSNRTAQTAAAAHAKQSGLHVEGDDSCDDWDYRRAADYLLERVRQLRQEHGPVCLISGGEVTVEVTQQSGVGGRNQQFALYCAEKITGDDITVLSAGTDGIDGNSPAAGAVVDGTTVLRARTLGIDVPSALACFDSFPVLERLGDSIVTGPTGTNVRDLRVLLAW
jgi:glycerate 2-kinase